MRFFLQQGLIEQRVNPGREQRRWGRTQGTPGDDVGVSRNDEARNSVRISIVHTDGSGSRLELEM